MKNITALKILLFLFIPVLCYADELILKDGRTISSETIWQQDGYFMYIQYGATVGIPEKMVEKIQSSKKENTEILIDDEESMRSRAVHIPSVPVKKNDSPIKITNGLKQNHELGHLKIFDMFWNKFIYLIGLAMFLLITAALLKTPVIKGIMGEMVVNFATRFFLNKKEYHLIKNVTFPVEDGTTQIDHIIVSKYGIFVVETKNMKGWIYGEVHQKNWTQVIYNHRTQFQNPLRQNYKHIKTLESTLNIPLDKIFSIVVFTGDCKFKTQMPENVNYITGYLSYIKSKKEIRLSDSEVKQAISDIEEKRLERSIKTNREHIRYVNNKAVDRG